MAEKVIAEKAAGRQHCKRLLLHRRMPHHARGEEEHGETLAAGLRVPDHARATVARLGIANEVVVSSSAETRKPNS